MYQFQSAAEQYSNKCRLRKQAIIIHFYYSSCTVLTCLVMQCNYHPLAHFFKYMICVNTQKDDCRI